MLYHQKKFKSTVLEFIRSSISRRICNLTPENLARNWTMRSNNNSLDWYSQSVLLGVSGDLQIKHWLITTVRITCSNTVELSKLWVQYYSRNGIQNVEWSSCMNCSSTTTNWRMRSTTKRSVEVYLSLIIIHLDLSCRWVSCAREELNGTLINFATILRLWISWRRDAFGIPLSLLRSVSPSWYVDISSVYNQLNVEHGKK